MQIPYEPGLSSGPTQQNHFYAKGIEAPNSPTPGLEISAKAVQAQNDIAHAGSEIATDMAQVRAQTQALSGIDQTMAALNDLKNNTSSGYSMRKGEDAQPKSTNGETGPSITQEYEKKAREHVDTIANGMGEAARKIYLQHAQTAVTNFTNGVSEHERTELVNYQKQTHITGVKTGNTLMEDAKTDEEFNMGKNRALAGVAALLKMEGIRDPDQVKVATAEMLSGSITRKISYEINHGAIASAGIMLGENKDLLTGNDYLQLKSSLSTGTDLEFAQKYIKDNVLGSNLSEEQMRANLVNDDSIPAHQKDLIEQRMEHRFAIVHNNNNLNKDEIAVTAWGEVMGERGELSPTTIERLNAFNPIVHKEIELFLRARDKKAAGLKPEDDNKKFSELMGMAGLHPNEFADKNFNLLQFEPYLSDSNFKHLVGIQLSMRSGENKAVMDNKVISNAIDALKRQKIGAFDWNAKPDTRAGKKVNEYVSTLTNELHNMREAGTLNQVAADEAAKKLARPYYLKGWIIDSDASGYDFANSPEKVDKVAPNLLYKDIPKVEAEMETRKFIRELGKGDNYVLTKEDEAEIAKRHTQGMIQGIYPYAKPKR